MNAHAASELQTVQLFDSKLMVIMLFKLLAATYATRYPFWKARKKAMSVSQQYVGQQLSTGLAASPDSSGQEKSAVISSTESADAIHSIHCDQHEDMVQLVAQQRPRGEFENWAQCELLLPHVQFLYEKRSCFHSTVELLQAWGQILTNTAWYLWRRGNYQEAQDIIVEALALRQSVLGPDNEHTLITLEILAGVLMSQCKYKEAEEVNRHALKGFQRTLGQQHTSTLTSISNLALVLHCQGNYKDAETFSRQAVKGSKKELGKLHVDTLKSIGNLALVLQQQGRYKEALKGFCSTLGADHPSTLTSMTNLGVLLERQGDLRQSQRFIWQAAIGKIRVLGVNHPSTLNSLSARCGQCNSINL
jgi:Tfp pilus assembly protein PilF